MDLRASLTLEKLLEPMKGVAVLWAESGEGCAHMKTRCLARLMDLPLSCHTQGGLSIDHIHFGGWHTASPAYRWQHFSS